MNYRSEALDLEAWKRVDELRRDFVIDLPAAERLHDIFVYLMLSRASKNQRGIALHQNALQKVLQVLRVKKTIR